MCVGVVGGGVRGLICLRERIKWVKHGHGEKNGLAIRQSENAKL